MRVLVLGAYGLIGHAVVRGLVAAGHAVTGLGRSAERGGRLVPGIAWVEADLARLASAADWSPLLAGIDAVVNAAGALQDGPKDDVAAVQHRAITALIGACEAAGIRRFVQISAPGAEQQAETAFMRTKALADAALRISDLDWTILKPGLVIDANAYGGTALLRMLAAMPVVQVLVLADRKVRVVASADVAKAVAMALAGQVPARRSFDLVSDERYRLDELVGRLRAWLGWHPVRFRLALPDAVGFGVARLADLAGRFGWRSPLRSTALRVLAQDVEGDPAPWQTVSGRPLPGLDAILASLPSTRQERSFAGMALVFPLLVLTLAFFWVSSGVIGLWRLDAAVAVLPDAMPRPMASALVIGGAGIDIAIGLGFLLRRRLAAAALASIGVSLGYLATASWLIPALWADPLGPLVKIFPAMALALAVLSQNDER